MNLSLVVIGVSLLLFAAAADAESTQECLARLTQERVKQIEDACWKLAENSAGTIADNSAGTQAAIECETDAKSKNHLSDMETQKCLALTPTTPLPDHEGTPGFTVPPPGPSTPPKPPTTPPKPPTTTPKPPIPKPTTPNKPTTSPPNTKPEDADTAQTHADQDLSACNTAKSQATQCCNNPLSCASSLSASDQQSLQTLTQQTNSGPQSGQSISDYCAQMKQASANSGSVNNGLAGVCSSNQSSCTSTCSQLQQKYQKLVDNCDDCDAESIYTSTLASLTGASSACQALKANASALAQQGVGSASGQGYGSVCAQNSSMNPQSMNMGGMGTGSMNSAPTLGNPSDPYNCAANPGSAVCQNCTINPNSPTCQALASSQPNPTGKTGFNAAGGKKEDGSGFNPASLDDAAATNAKMNLAPVTSPQGTGNQAAVVPNNSGGGIPGANNGSPYAGASLGTTGRAGSMAAVAGGSVTDIMQGNRSGGYSQGSGFETFSPPTRGLANSKPASSATYVGMDLKKYLPGGSRDPQRVAGLGTASIEINGKGVDLFKKISNKMEEMCKLGILWECKP